MKTAFLYAPRKLVIKDAPKPEIGPNEILVRVRAIGICPSDLRYFTGSRPADLIPLGEQSYGLTGHEWVGEVVEVGPGVKDIEVGDHVAPDFLIPCGRCKYCAKGMTNICINKRYYIRGYAEYAKAYAPLTYKLRKDVPFEEACFTEPLSCVINANYLSGVQAGDDVAIIGAGPMGLLHLQVFKLSGARVFSIDLLDQRLELAKSLGADVTINPTKEDPVKVVKDLTDGMGADIVVVSVGNKKAIEQGLKLACKAGKVIIFGGTYPPTEISVDPNYIHYNQIWVTGSFDHTAHTFKRAIKLISEKMIKLRPLISHILPLDELEKGFNIVENKQGLKVVITP